MHCPKKAMTEPGFSPERINSVEVKPTPFQPGGTRFPTIFSNIIVNYFKQCDHQYILRIYFFFPNTDTITGLWTGHFRELETIILTNGGGVDTVVSMHNYFDHIGLLLYVNTAFIYNKGSTIFN